MNRLKNAAPFVFALVLLACTGSALLAQVASGLPGSNMAAQSLRPYWHVFIAYAIAITVVLGWVISIGRRLRQVENQLGE